MDFPEWMMPLRVAATFLIWLMCPVLLWSAWTTRRQWRLWRQWEAAEVARRVQWRQDMEAAGKMYEAAGKQLEEAGHLRVQAEIALAQARQQVLRADGNR